MPIILTGDKYNLLETVDSYGEIKSSSSSSPSIHSNNKSSSSSSTAYPSFQGWLRRQLIPVLIRSKINDSKLSWNGSVDLSINAQLTSKNGDRTKLPTTINGSIDNNGNNDCDHLGNNLSSPRHFLHQPQEVITNNANNKAIDPLPPLINVQSQSAPCTPKFMMKRPPLESIYGSTEVDTISGSGEIDLLSRQLVEKDKLLTDLRLELLSTEDQIEELRELIGKLGKQLVNLREENKRLNNLVDSLTPLTCFKLSRVEHLPSNYDVNSNKDEVNNVNQSTVTF